MSFLRRHSRDRQFAESYPLHAATLHIDISRLIGLLNEGTPVDSPGPNGVTALMMAAAAANVEVMSLLLRHGANPNARNPKGASPLTFAVGGGSVGAVRYLLRENADPGLPGSFNGRNAPLLASLLNKKVNAEILLALLEAGADLNVWDSHEGRPLDIARDRRLKEVESILLSYGAEQETA